MRFETSTRDIGKVTTNCKMQFVKHSQKGWLIINRVPNERFMLKLPVNSIWNMQRMLIESSNYFGHSLIHWRGYILNCTMYY